MLITTTESVSNHKVVKTYGLVRGSSVRARNIGKDILAIFRMIAGGEVSEYSKLLNESRDQALQRMIDNANNLDENAKDYNILNETIQKNNIFNIMSNSFGFGGTNATLVFEKI